MEIPGGLYYSKSHEWVRVDSDSVVTIGITDHAQDSLGEVVYVELPEVEDEFLGEDEFGVVESVKAASDLIMPIACKIVGVNDALSGSPDLINSSPYDEGWLVKVELVNESDLESLLDAEAYEEFLNSEDE